MVTAVKTEHPYIVKNPEICGGSPTISGTRISVRLIASRVKCGDASEDILRDYPHLTLAQIHDAISYYFDHKEELEKELQEGTIREIMKKNNLRLIPDELKGIDRLITEEEYESLSEEKKEKAYTWETLPEKYN